MLMPSINVGLFYENNKDDLQTLYTYLSTRSFMQLISVSLWLTKRKRKYENLDLN